MTLDAELDPCEAIEPEPPIEARWVEHTRHVFHSDPRNALRPKSYDAFGRWTYADTGTTYNLSEAGYAALLATKEKPCNS